MSKNANGRKWRCNILNGAFSVCLLVENWWRVAFCRSVQANPAHVCIEKWRQRKSDTCSTLSRKHETEPWTNVGRVWETSGKTYEIDDDVFGWCHAQSYSRKSEKRHIIDQLKKEKQQLIPWYTIYKRKFLLPSFLLLFLLLLLLRSVARQCSIYFLFF